MLGWELADGSHDDVAMLPSDDTGFQIRFRATRPQKIGPNQIHLHLTSTSLADQQETVAKAVGLGARHIDIGQGRSGGS